MYFCVTFCIKFQGTKLPSCHFCGFSGKLVFEIICQWWLFNFCLNCVCLKGLLFLHLRELFQTSRNVREKAALFTQWVINIKNSLINKITFPGQTPCKLLGRFKFKLLHNYCSSNLTRILASACDLLNFNQERKCDHSQLLYALRKALYGGWSCL